MSCSVNATREPVLNKYQKRAIALLGVSLLLSVIPEISFAQDAGMQFPIVDQMLCGFYSYSRQRLAPLIAAIVVIFSWLGHLLGSGKAWTTMLNVGMGLGVIMSIGSLIVRYTSIGGSCLVG